MSREPRRLADADLDPSPDAALLRRIIHAHRNGRPDDEEMARLSACVQPFLTAERRPVARLPGWLAGALVSAIFVGGAGWGLSRTYERPASSGGAVVTVEDHAATAKPADSATNTVGAPEESGETPALSVRALPDAKGPSVGTVKRVAAATTDETSAPSDCDEVALVERAGKELRSGQAARALATTHQHETGCVGGVLVQERERIAIEALAMLGRTGEARARASSFATRFPSSPHLRRVRQVIEATPE
ncbi:hypothetical protein AKJ09_03235 [Labilithrix luteola]|uniref:Uncharacterized protein n=1 Tax=Labilithrix luteola TaxID=1391654 RepID=A0A0K1PT57_9BACT|nr:hypothetical protein [Labilithrix luteola]AKU96571.1 hypothetical protein AKJ09_03235 [Labilithrix luteola]